PPDALLGVGAPAVVREREVQRPLPESAADLLGAARDLALGQVALVAGQVDMVLRVRPDLEARILLHEVAHLVPGQRKARAAGLGLQPPLDLVETPVPAIQRPFQEDPAGRVIRRPLLQRVPEVETAALRLERELLAGAGTEEAE